MALSLNLRSAFRAAALAALAVLVAGVAAACLDVGGGSEGGDGEEPSPSPAEPSPADPELVAVYEQVAEAMTRPGQVYRFRVEAVSERGEMETVVEGEYWIDVENGFARQDLATTDANGEVVKQTQIVRGDMRTITSGDSTAEAGVWVCPGISPAASFYLNCDDRPGETTVSDGEFEGTSAVVLEYRREVGEFDQFKEYAQITYLDAQTMLPLAVVIDAITLVFDEEVDFLGTSRVVEDGFVDRESLPDDHFEQPDPNSG